ncbi:activating signal cointegrator 1 [Tripterygium wilfordii]|uniref:Activating signal cointegrator 1 n=1 Tax=Tripterygium wilfordii TaxID=458696 RepID=A0A7J7CKV5_TRIWF|nr:activating signal cointegrator 1 [Tripterygium wilfordii]KAF5734692.1 activating signal cointegrator 1 [Tripterygium wilfordii]
MESPGQWLENALVDLCKKVETGLDLDRDIISGLVSYCDLAEPLDAKEYLDNIIGQEIGKSVIEEYLLRRGPSNIGGSTSDASTSKLHAYVKPPSNEHSASGVKMPLKGQKEVMVPGYRTEQKRVTMSSNPADPEKSTVSLTAESKTTHKGNQSGSKKKKSGKVISLAEAAKGSVVFQQGKPCSCQARRHSLVSNCLSCGKIVCEQEGEGPCSFCGVLVLREGSTYAGLEDGLPLLSDAEVAAEAYAKRLVEYDRNSAARTTVIDDQSDYYEIEGNGWLSPEERELLKKKREEIEEAARAKRSKVVVTFDLFGRKVLLNEDEISELQSEDRILRPQDEREANRIKPNPTLKIQPHFVAPDSSKNPDRGKLPSKSLSNGLCLEITGRVQHENNGLKYLMNDNKLTTA